MAIHICINYVVFPSLLLYAANTEFLFHIVDSEPNLGDLRLCGSMWIYYRF